MRRSNPDARMGFDAETPALLVLPLALHITCLFGCQPRECGAVESKCGIGMLPRRS